MSKIKIIILVWFYASVMIMADDFNCKIRLPININCYSPVIVPVISIDNKFLYFDRKEHPQNTGGCKDVDDIWYSKHLNNGIWTNPEKLSNPVNSNSSNVLFSLSPDGKKALLYTDYYIGSHKLSGFVTADRNDNNFTNIKPLKIKYYYNDSKHFYGFLSADNKILLLSIKSRDCLGKEDLYVSFYNENLQIWSEPLNLGKEINSEFDEISPFLAYDGKTLYFSSNRKGGFGSYDLYFSKRLDESWTSWSQPKNLSEKINTQFKENGIYLTALSDSAYIITSELKIIRNDNINKPIDTIALRSGIYKVCIPKSFQPEPYVILKGEISNKKEQILNKQKIYFTINDNNSKTNYSTNDGTFLFVLNAGKEYHIKVSTEELSDFQFVINTVNLKRSKFITKNIVLEERINKQFAFPIVYFAYNKSNLSKLNKQKLNETIKRMGKTNKIIFKIFGYADTSGSEKYNYSLSTERAENIKRYLISLGINSKNIIVEGKGETQRFGLNDEKNRRVEIFLSK